MSYQSVVLADSPLGYWRGASGTSTETDLGSGGNNGTYIGSPTLQQASLLPSGEGQSFSLNGTSQYLTVPGVTYAVGDTFTIEAWFKDSDVSVWRSIFGESGTTPPVLEVGDAGSGILSGEKSGTADIVDATTTIVNGSTYYAVWTKATSTNHIYINGSDVTGTVTNATFGNPGAGDTNWGVQANESANFWKGSLQELAIYGTALSAAKVSAHYAAAAVSAGGFLPNPNWIRRLRNPMNIH